MRDAPHLPPHTHTPQTHRHTHTSSPIKRALLRAFSAGSPSSLQYSSSTGTDLGVRVCMCVVSHFLSHTLNLFLFPTCCLLSLKLHIQLSPASQYSNIHTTQRGQEVRRVTNTHLLGFISMNVDSALSPFRTLHCQQEGNKFSGKFVPIPPESASTCSTSQPGKPSTS